VPNLKYPANWQNIARKIKIEANWICQHCHKQCLTTQQLKGKSKKDSSKVTLSVHHIDCNRFNITNDNLIALCLDCHKKEHQRLWLKEKRKRKKKQRKNNR
jgi:thymidine kinase